MAVILRQHLDSRCGDVKLGDLTPRRDLTYVLDTVKAFMAVGDPSLPINGEVFNCGSGKSISIGALADMITDKPIKQDANRLRANDVMALEADWTKINKATGWRPQIPLGDGVRITTEWWRHNLYNMKKEATYVV